jgi:hypothetical protein
MKELISKKSLEGYFKGFKVTDFKPLGRGVHGEGYLITVKKKGEEASYVIKAVRPEGFGHDYPSDRAAMFLLALDTYGGIPNHVKAIDVLSLNEKGELKSIGGGREYFLLMEKADGRSYFNDLREFSKKNDLDEIDVRKIKTMAGYLGRLHSLKKDSRTLYLRKIRDIIGHGECLMGVFDTYPEGALSFKEMAEIEKKCIDRRAALKKMHKRLCRIHGDFHPGNIWFKDKPEDFILLDRSRGPWGEAADDLTALTINYIFFSIRYHNSVKGPYLRGLGLFFDEYIEKTADKHVLDVVAPFYAFRGAVVANPLFYPELTKRQRRLIFRFMHGVLDAGRFDPKKVNGYID